MQRMPVAIPSLLLGTSPTSIYSPASGVTATASNVTLTNTSNGVVSVSIYRVPSSGSPVSTNAVLGGTTAFNLVPGVPYLVSALIGQNISAGETLYGQASVASVVNVTGGVYETSGS